MSNSVQMPALGESVTEGTVTRWLKSVGDRVEVDEPLLEVSTDKVDTEIPSPYGGVLEEILVAEDDTAEVGADLAIIGDGSGASGSGADSGTESDSGAGGGATEQDEAQGPGQAAATTQGSAGTDEQPEAGEPAAAGEAEPARAQVDQQSAADAEPQQDSGSGRSGSQSGSGQGGGSGTPVTLPAMGESVTEGTVTRWLKAVGDHVDQDEPLVEVSTDKVDTEIPSPVSGTLLEITAQEDETLEVGAQLAVIGQAGATGAPPAEPEQQEPPAGQAVEADSGTPESDARTATTPEPAPPTAPEQRGQEERAPEPDRPVRSTQTQPEQTRTTRGQAGPPPARPTSGSTPEGVYLTPVIRKLAADSGVDLSTVKGTGVGGRIRREDVLAAAEAARRAAAEAQQADRRAATAQAAPAASTPSAPGGVPSTGQPDDAALALIGTTQKLPRIRQSIARNMKHGLDTAAQLTTVMEVDVTRVAQLRSRAKASFAAREGVPLSFLPFFAKAAIEAVKVFPVINSSLSDDLKEITYHGKVHLGVAVDTPRGLIVPVIKDADDLNIAGIARRIRELAERTRANKIGPDDLSGGTLTLTNTGSVGALFDTPIFVPPQSAILGTGLIVKRPTVISDADGNDVIAIRSMCYLALSYDHRNIDGADASRFLSAVKDRIEAGAFEGDLGL